MKMTSKKMTAVGDEWRVFALHCANFVRKKTQLELREIGEMLHTIAEHEAEVFRRTRSYR